MIATITRIFICCLFIFHQTHVPVNAICSEPNVIEEDILGNGRHSRQRRGATSYQKRLWPGAVIPYDIAKTFSNETASLIRQAMDHWQSYTCLDFVERTDETDYVNIYSGKGCCSYVGRSGGKQKLSLGMGCDAFGIIVHELGHAVGFWHEQSRPDRDNYVRVLYNNVYAQDRHNFKKVGRSQVNSREQRYDFHSIMHYGYNFFSKRGDLDTILPKLRGIRKEELGKRYFSQRDQPALSDQDIIQTNLMYKCNIFNENGGTIFARSGSFHSPNYPSPYSVSRDRVWIVTTESSLNATTSLTLHFDDFSVGSNDGTGICKNDYLDIRNGKGFLSDYLVQLCGNSKPDPITVLNDSIYVRLHSVLPVHKSPHLKKGFSVQFKTDACSGHFTLLQGSFTTPNYPKSYEPFTDCVWQITVPRGYRIRLLFSTFRLKDVDNKKGCLDYIDLRDGNTPFSKFIGRFCGLNKPVDITSTSTSLRVIFHSTNSTTQQHALGFKARYLAVDVDECAEKLSECDQACLNTRGSYICGCQAGYSFLHRVLGTCVDKNECEVNNGGCSHGCENTNGGFYCTCPPGHYLVSQGKICTDINECDLNPCAHKCRNFVGGFQCSCKRGYQLNEDDKRTCDDIDECQQSPCTQACINTPGSYLCSCRSGYMFDEKMNDCRALATCGKLRVTPSGKIRSPRLPRYFRHTVECNWHVRISSAKMITASVSISWTKDEKCSNYVQLQYSTFNRKVTLKLCGKEEAGVAIVIRNNHFSIKYHVESGRRNSATLTYSSSSKEHECKQMITKTSGIIQTPGFPFKYPPNTQCEWDIKNTESHPLRLKFNFFEVESQSSCDYDFLDVRATSRGVTKHVGRFCGSSISSFFNIDPGEKMTLIFYSDSTIQRRGFHADFQLA